MNSTPEPLYRGKVRDMYALPDPDQRLIVTSDRISIFDVVMRQTIPNRGKILTAMTDFWLNTSLIATIAPNHLVPVTPEELPDWAQTMCERIRIVRVAAMQPVKWMVRDHLVGSAWREYRESGTVQGVCLPPGMRECEALPAPVVTLSAKMPRGAPDTRITFDDAVDMVSGSYAEEARRMCLEAYRIAAAHALEHDVVLLDTTFELGYIDGHLALCDDILTPDSSRFVLAEDVTPGHPPIGNDKEHLRQWARCIGWTGEGRPPHLDGYIIRDLVRMYHTIYTRLTG